MENREQSKKRSQTIPGGLEVKARGNGGDRS